VTNHKESLKHVSSADWLCLKSLNLILLRFRVCVRVYPSFLRVLFVLVRVISWIVPFTPRRKIHEITQRNTKRNNA